MSDRVKLTILPNGPIKVAEAKSLRYMGENIDAYKSGQVALQMNFAFIWPGVEADPNVGGGKSGYFPNPAGPNGHFAQLGGQGISVVAYSEKQDAALEYIKWFAQPDVQKKWWEAGGYSALRAVVEDPGFATSQPYAQTFLDSMAIVKDFWAEPAYADLLLSMQDRVHNYVIAGDGTAHPPRYFQQYEGQHLPAVAFICYCA